MERKDLYAGGDYSVMRIALISILFVSLAVSQPIDSRDEVIKVLLAQQVQAEKLAVLLRQQIAILQAALNAVSIVADNDKQSADRALADQITESCNATDGKLNIRGIACQPKETATKK